MAIDATHLRTLYDYSYWARDRVLNAAKALSQEEYERDLGFTYRSLRGILLHAAWAEAAWLARWTGQAPVPRFEPEDLPTLAALELRWGGEGDKMRRFLAALKDEDLTGRVIEYLSGRTGVWQKDPLGELMVHVVNHATQHRAEAAEALTMLGRSPGDLDMLDFFRLRRARG